MMAFDLSTAKPEQEQPSQQAATVTGGFDISTAKAEAPQAQDTSLIDSVGGGVSAAATVGSEIAGTALGGLTALVDVLNPFTENDPTELIEAVKNKVRIDPSKQGEAALQELSAAVEPLQPVIQAVSDFKNTAGQQGLDLTGSPAFATFVNIIPNIIAEVGGLGAASKATKAAAATGRGAPCGFDFESPTKAKVRELLERGEADAETAGFKLKPTDTGTGKAKVVKDKLEGAAVKQGFDKGVVAALKGTSGTDKSKLLKMVETLEKGKKNAKFAITNRPTDIAGDTLMNRVKVIDSANTKAGKELDIIADSLKGQKVDVTPAVQNFSESMTDLGVKLTRGDDGKVKPDFSESDIVGLSGPESIIKRVINRIDTTEPLDANKLHRIKRFIDTQVSFGKKEVGLEGKAAIALKKLRRDIDGILDNQFPEYDRVNSVYSETVGALDSLKDIAGKKMDLSGPNAEKATGTLLRRIMGNAQSRVALLDSIENIETVAKKHGKPGKGMVVFDPKKTALATKGKGVDISKQELDSDLLTQILFADELDRVFGSSAKTSLAGDVEKAVGRGAQLLPVESGVAGAAALAAQKAIEKARGVNETNAFKSIKELLKKGKK